MPKGTHADGSPNRGRAAANGRNVNLTAREERALTAENEGSTGRRAAVIAGRAFQARIVGAGKR